LAQDEVLLTVDNWTQTRDALYIAETVARDAENDLAANPTKAEMLEIIRNLVQAIDAAAGVHAEPKAIGDLDS
jgi:hypothetical protein